MAQAPIYQRQEFFQASPGNTGAGDVARGLANAFQMIGDTSTKLSGEAQNRKIAADKAHVSAIATDIEVQIDYASKAFPDDEEKFKDYTGAALDGSLSAAPEELHGAVYSAVNKKFRTSLNTVVVANQKKDNAILVTENSNIITSLSNTGFNYARDLDTEGVEIQRQLLLNTVNNELYSDKEKLTILNNYDKKVRTQKMVGTALKISETTGYLSAYKTLQSFNENGITGIDPSEVKSMVSEARQVLDQQRAVITREQTESDNLYTKTSNTLTNELLTQATLVHNNPFLQTQTLDKARGKLESGEIQYDQYSKVIKEIEAPQGYDNVLVVEDLYTSIYSDESPDITDEMITDARIKGDLTPQKATALRKDNQVKKNRIANNSNDPVIREQNNAFTVLKIKLTGSSIIEKTMGQDKERVGRAIAEWHDRMRAYDPETTKQTPNQIADDIAIRYGPALKITSFPNTRFGTKGSAEEVKASQAELLANESQLSPGDFLREVELLEELEAFYAAKENKL